MPETPEEARLHRNPEALKAVDDFFAHEENVVLHELDDVIAELQIDIDSEDDK